MRFESYPVNVVLRKLSTLADAEYPQEKKYPSGQTERRGLMWEHTAPAVGRPFCVMQSKLWPSFMTSPVTEILEDAEGRCVFKTLNSTYELVEAIQPS